MSRVWCLVVLCFAVVLSVVCVSAFAQSPVAAAGHEVALLPEPGASPPTAQATEPTAVAPAEPAAEPPKQIAQLFGPTPAAGSAADLIDRAMECDWAWDYDRKAEYLLEVANGYPGSKEAGEALILLARTYCDLGRQPEADTALARVAGEQADPGFAALAAATSGVCLALQSKDFERAKSLLLDVAEQWSGTQAGALAALQAGEIERDYIFDFDAAIPYYQAAAAAYPNSLVEQEAEVAIAESLAWSWQHPAEAADAFQRALENVTNPRLRAQAVVGLGEVLNQVSEYTRALDVLTGFIGQSPDHPFTPIARGYRSLTTSWLGNWDLAVDDARAFLASPAAKRGHPWIAHCGRVAAQYAFQHGDSTGAEAQFRQTLVAPEAEAKALAWAGIAYCQTARGDPTDAVSSFLQAAGFAPKAGMRCDYLYAAALAAQAGGDRAAERQITNQMRSEFPGSELTTRLVGYEVLPAPAI